MNGLVWKDILRTGKWSHTPTSNGVIEKELQIIEDGESDPEMAILLSEIVRNFDEGAVPYVTIPLSDEEKKDHKNTARVNTGFVRKLKLFKNGAITLLRAGMDFTEPDIKEKALRGTIPDVSSGIPFGVTRRRDNKIFKAVLDHVCLTRKPWVDGRGRSASRLPIMMRLTSLWRISRKLKVKLRAILQATRKAAAQ